MAVALSWLEAAVIWAGGMRECSFVPNTGLCQGTSVRKLQPFRLHLFTVCLRFPKPVTNSPPFRFSSLLTQDVGLGSGMVSTLLPHSAQGF